MYRVIYGMSQIFPHSRKFTAPARYSQDRATIVLAGIV
jgi:hypothetical protein